MFPENTICVFIAEFPSPINGVSFKQPISIICIFHFDKKFPSPKSGVSFKHTEGDDQPPTDYTQFPSPKSGVSFKPDKNYLLC